MPSLNPSHPWPAQAGGRRGVVGWRQRGRPRRICRVHGRLGRWAEGCGRVAEVNTGRRAGSIASMVGSGRRAAGVWWGAVEELRIVGVLDLPRGVPEVDE
jgi:hypothetical protein